MNILKVLKQNLSKLVRKVAFREYKSIVFLILLIQQNYLLLFIYFYEIM